MSLDNTYTRYNFFGLDFWKKSMTAGSIYRSAHLKNLDQKTHPYIFIYTKGTIEIKTNRGKKGNFVTRTPGTWTGDLTNTIVRGTYVSEAVTDAEWWCCSRQQVEDGNYLLSKVYVEKDNNFTLDSNSRYVFFAGSFSVDNNVITAPVPVEIGDTSRNIVATETLIGYKLTQP